MEQLVKEGLVKKTSGAWSGETIYAKAPRPPEHTHGFDRAPARYDVNGKEVIDIIREELGDEGFKAFCHGAELKYKYRDGKKGDPTGDKEKARWFREMRLHIENPENNPDPRSYRREQ